MKCPNCLKEMPENANICRWCETDVREHMPPCQETRDAINEFIADLPVEQIEHLDQLHRECETAEDFANAILVGNCPACGGTKVGDCDEDPDYMNSFLGRCFECGAVWCTECEHVLGDNEKECPRFDEHMEELDEIISDEKIISGEEDEEV